MLKFWNHIKNKFHKRIILVENKNQTVNIFSTFKKVQNCPEISKYVKSDMTLLNGETFSPIVSDDDSQPIGIYSVQLNGDNSELNDNCLMAVNTYNSNNERYLVMNIFGAYTFKQS